MAIDQTTSHFLDPLPKQPWSADVRIWRSGDSTDPCGASIPRTVIWHSPDGWNFGYGGSGPADLALNILNAFVPPRSSAAEEIDTGEDWDERDDDPVRCYRGVCSAFAARHHQEFKREFIAAMQPPGDTLSVQTIEAWIAHRRMKGHA